MLNDKSLSRRSFLERTAALTAGAIGANIATKTFAGESKTHGLQKAVKWNMIETNQSMVEKFKLLKELGFDGVEMNGPAQEDRDAVIRARDESGLAVHGVVNPDQWKYPLSDPDPAVRARCVDNLKQAIRDSKYYGGTSVLLVLGKVTKQVSYDDVYRRTQAELRKVLPLAEELGIHILFENVWNNFLLSPMEAARFVDRFESPMAGFYFDVGNVVRYGWPEHWIHILNKRIGKLDIKEFSRAKSDNEGLRKGFGVELGEGDCDWPAVMKALGEIGFKGWATAEVPGGDRERLAFLARRMDQIFAS